MWKEFPGLQTSKGGEKSFTLKSTVWKKKTNKFIMEQAILNVEKFMDDGSMCDDGVEA